MKSPEFLAKPERMSGDRTTAPARWTLLVAGLTLLLAVALSGRSGAQAQNRSLMPPGAQAPAAGPGAGPGTIGPSLVAPNGAAPPPLAPPGPTPVQTIPIVPSGQVALAVQARFGREPPQITAGLLWRVYADKPTPQGQFRLIKEDRSANPIFLLPPGGYVVHVSFGFANTARRVQLRAETVREVFELAAGGVRFEGKVGDAKIPPGQIFFEIHKGSQFEPGEKHALVEQIASGDIVLLPEGLYHVVSNYGDGNAVMRSDFRVQAAKLTDMRLVHRAARIMLKLVSDKGGEALANTQWSVLTPAGDVIKESIGAFPSVILAEGDYLAVAKNDNKVYSCKFKVEAGVDREFEVTTRNAPTGLDQIAACS